MLPITKMCDLIKTSSHPEQQHRLMLYQVKKACWDGYISYYERIRMENELDEAYREVVKDGY